MELEKIKIKKCIKSYLCGKKYISSDIKKAKEYLEQTLKIIKDIKKKSSDTIIEETETECEKLLSNINNNELDLFTIVKTGNIKALKQNNYKENDFYIYDSNGLTPLHVAIQYGDTQILKYAFSLGVEIDTPTLNEGYTLLEYTSLLGDYNIIDFLINNGSNIQKHKDFRYQVKYLNKQKQIDISLIMKIILVNNNKNDNKLLDFMSKYINYNNMIGLDNIIMKELIFCIQDLLEKSNYADTYINILKEELSYDLNNNNGCPKNKLDIIIYNLVPFINYPYNLSLRWLIQLEINYTILKINKNKDDKKCFLIDIFNKYIKSKIFNHDYIQNFLTHSMLKINI